MIATWVQGSKLPANVQREILNRYPYRMTHESIARWPSAAATMRAGGFRLAVLSDAEWLASTRFAITKHGTLDRRVTHCFSSR